MAKKTKKKVEKKVTDKQIEKIKDKLKKGEKLTKADIEIVKKYKEQKQKESPLTKFLPKADVKAVEEYAASVLKKFTKYIKAVAVWGSLKTGKGKRKTSDIDIAIIVDDTDVTRLTRVELKDKLFQRLIEQAYPLSKKIHPQPYLLTEFWEYVREGNPVIYNLLKDGIILYDTGFFLPIQQLQRMGNITPSKECVDKRIIVAPKLLKSSKDQLTHSLTHALAQAVINSAQAVLMELGYRPPAQNEIGEFVENFLVKKHKIVPAEYGDIAKKVIKTYKDVEHKEIKNVSGKLYDDLYDDSEKFVNRMKKELLEIRKAKGETYLYEYFEKQKKKEKEEKKTKKRDDTGKVEERKIQKSEEIIKKEVGQR